MNAIKNKISILVNDEYRDLVDSNRLFMREIFQFRQIYISEISFSMQREWVRFGFGHTVDRADLGQEIA
jgi:hypothetical protein